MSLSTSREALKKEKFFGIECKPFQLPASGSNFDRVMDVSVDLCDYSARVSSGKESVDIPINHWLLYFWFELYAPTLSDTHFYKRHKPQFRSPFILLRFIEIISDICISRSPIYLAINVLSANSPMQ